MEKINTKIDKHNTLMYNIPVEIHNITTHKQVSYPHRKVIIEQSCKIWAYGFPVLNLNRHWRNGEELPELEYFAAGKALNPERLAALEKFIYYCRNIVQFHKENAFFIQNMEDPWCFEHPNIGYCFVDFMEVYNLMYRKDMEQINPEDLFPFVKLLEQEWAVNFYSDIEPNKFVTIYMPPKEKPRTNVRNRNRR